MTYQPKVYRKQGGADLVIASGGKLDLESGSTMTVAGDVTLTAATIAGTATVSAGLNITGYTRIPYQSLSSTQTATEISQSGVTLLATSTGTAPAYTLATPSAAGILKELIVTPTSAAGTCTVFSGSTGRPFTYGVTSGNTLTLGTTRHSVTLLSLGTSAWQIVRGYNTAAPTQTNKST